MPADDLIDLTRIARNRRFEEGIIFETAALCLAGQASQQNQRAIVKLADSNTGE